MDPPGVHVAGRKGQRTRAGMEEAAEVRLNLLS